MRTLEEFRVAIRELDKRQREHAEGAAADMATMRAEFEAHREADRRDAEAAGRTQGLIYGGLVSIVVTVIGGLILNAS